MTKAKLRTGQVVAGVLAGVAGNILFSAGITLFGGVLLAGLFAGLLGAAFGGIFGQSSESVDSFLQAAGGVAIAVVIGVVVVALVIMVVGVLASAGILAIGGVRRPWAVTLKSVLISTVITVPLTLAYLGISNNGDSVPYVLVAFLGTVIFGVLIWLWMTWAHRGPEVEGPVVPTMSVAPARTTVTPPAVPDL